MAQSDDIWPIAIALGVGVLLIKNWGQPVVDLVNIGPETKAVSYTHLTLPTKA